MGASLTFAQTAWLVFLFVVWGGLLFGGFAFGRLDERRVRRMPAWTRMASSLTLVIAGWSWYAFNRVELSLLIAAGMTLGFLGDLFMAHWLRGPNPELGGIAAFGLGHIAYCAAFLRFGDQMGLNQPALRWPAWGIWLAIGALGWYSVVFRAGPACALRWPALPYVLLLASTAGLALGLALHALAFAPVALGGALFLSSDLILALELFCGARFYLINDLIWLTYGPAQMLIVLGAGLAVCGLR